MPITTGFSLRNTAQPAEGYLRKTRQPDELDKNDYEGPGDVVVAVVGLDGPHGKLETASIARERCVSDVLNGEIMELNTKDEMEQVNSK
jgi:hypothetical protein